MVIQAAVLLKGLAILLNRVASWFGSGYFIRRGFRRKKKRFIVFGILFSLLMLWVLHLIFRHKF